MGEQNFFEALISAVRFIFKYSELIFEYTANHFSLVLTVLFFSLIFWISLGLIIGKYDKFAGPVISLGNLIFCIPAISLFGLFVTIPLLGLGRRSAALALILYAMMPLVRNVYRGIKSVDNHVIEAGRGMGMNSFEILTKIQIPMAWPIVFAGIRVTVVLITGMATIATFIGERNLGRLIHHGITRGNSDMIIAGAIVVSLIALILDYLLGLLQKKLTSPGLAFDNRNL